MTLESNETIDSVPVKYGFKLICSSKANNLIPVHKYKSVNTGITVVLGEVEGPVVNGYFALATEAHDDDGLPHTLEHLIFLGSEDYPYKGVLDLLANRCMASGTNAWTDTDHTCYTMTTAGSEGFLSLMPIYLDHILYPLLTDAGFTTEVHHITGEGKDGGVVYCEMQGRENTGESRVNLELQREVYPGHCGYKSETGGIMSNLRDSTTNEKIRTYHKAYYRPENLCLIITGQVEAEEVFKMLKPFEEKIMAKGSRDEFVRPWQSSVPPLPISVDKEVPYSCDEEDNGMVYIGWRGPSAVTELYKLTACAVLLKYLTDTPVSPLPKEFVDIPDPYCSQVAYSIIENSSSLVYFTFENVPKDKLNLIKSKMLSLLSDIVEGKLPIDINRLVTVIRRHRAECLTHIENNPHFCIASMAIGDMLYGNTKEDLDQRLNQIAELIQLETEPVDFWVELIRQFLVDAPHVVIRGVPSIEEQKRLAKDEDERLAARVKELGKEGLAEKEALMMKSTEENEKPPPPEMLTCVPIPNINSINFHSIESFTSKSEKQHPNFDVTNSPLFFQIDHIKTNFVYLFVLMDSSELSQELRFYLQLYFELIMESPIQRGDEQVTYEEVVAQLEADTVASTTRIGLESASRFTCGPFSHTTCLMLQVEPNKFGKGIQWIRELLYETKLTPDRIRIVANKIINDVAQAKRQGNKMARDLLKGLLFSKESNHYSISLLRQHKFLTKVLEQLSSPEQTKEVISQLEQIRITLCHPKNVVVHMAANCDALLKSDVTLLSQILPSPPHPSSTPSTLNSLHVTEDWRLLNSDDNQGRHVVVGMGAVESFFMCQAAPGIKDFDHEDLAPLLVFLQYLTQLEGPMWKQIRGLGHAYSYNMVPRPNEGQLYLTFYRATNVVAAYTEAKNIIESHLKPDTEWDSTLFDSAKTSLIFEIIDREKSIGDVVAQSLLTYFKHVPHDYNKTLVQKIIRVNSSDLAAIGQKYLVPLLDPKVVRTSIVCHPTQTQHVLSSFDNLGFKFTVYSSPFHFNLQSSFKYFII
uniref:Uncharacterized protein C05D11.1 n=1 Tax=Cacopsylla melanoneura TaxID=428564 RepID=A0A8D8XF76_9HEMI